MNLQSSNKIEYAIQLQNPYRKYKSYVKAFNSEEHFSNWFAMMVRKNYKIISAEKIEANGI